LCCDDYPSGGFFQCNRFIPTSAVDGLASANDDDDDDDDIGGSGSLADLELDFLRQFSSDDRGSAQAETLRMKRKGKTMQRFIHHFTRFRAHAESAELEAKMRFKYSNSLNVTLYLCACVLSVRAECVCCCV